MHTQYAKTYAHHTRYSERTARGSAAFTGLQVQDRHRDRVVAGFSSPAADRSAQSVDGIRPVGHRCAEITPAAEKKIGGMIVVDTPV